jgi:hypothetical protein
MKAFPHLRVIGKSIPLSSSRQLNPIDYYEELIAIDPPALNHHHHHQHQQFKLLDKELNEKLSLRKSRQNSASKNQLKNENLEKLLRITSSGLTRNQYQQQLQPQLQKTPIDRRATNVDKTSTFLIKQNNLVPINLKKLSQIKERESPTEKLSYSASNSSRIEPLLNVKFLYAKSESLNVKSASSKLPIYEIMTLERTNSNDHSSKSAKIYTKNPNIIQLPPFNYELDFPIIQGRAIQSAVGKTSKARNKH